MWTDLISNIWPVIRSFSRVDRLRYGFYSIFLVISNVFDFLGIVAMSFLAIKLIYPSGQSYSNFNDKIGIVDANMHQSIIMLTCIIIISFILKSIFGITFIAILFRFLTKRATELSKRLYESILKNRDAKSHDNNSQGIAIMLTNGVQAAVVDALGYIAIAFSEVLLIVIIGLILITLMPINAILVITYFSFVVFGLNRFISLKSRINEEISIRSFAKAIEHVQETLNLKKEIVLFDKVRFFANTFEDVYKKRSGTVSYLQTLGLLPKYILEAFLIFGVALFALVGLLLGDSRSLAVEIMLIFTASARVLPAFLRFQASWLQVSRSIVASSEIIELMKMDLKDGEIARNEIAMTDRKVAVSIQNLSYSYSGREFPVLKNLSFDIDENSIFVIRGGSGAGKTTLINLIMGFLTPNEGDIYFQSLGNSPFKRIALVSQESKFINATILENIALGEKPDQVSVPSVVKALTEANISDEVLSLPKGIYENLGENSLRFSGGQKQRLAIARALYTESRILIFDEPTSALDDDSTSGFIQLIRVLSEHRTIVVVTHDKRIVECADKVLHI